MKRFVPVCLLLLLIVACKSKKPVLPEDDGIITFKFIQLNDVYEIAPLGGGKYGGMARVAYVRDSIAEVNTNTFMFMAGDFLNPSLLGTIKLDGERIEGRQMIEVMNAMNFDLVTFGNHEFDIGRDGLQKRLDESEFTWTTANVYEVTEEGYQPFKVQRDIGNIPIKQTHRITIRDKDGTEASIGFFSVTISSNPQDFVYYSDYKSEAKAAFNSLDRNCDLVFGLTHLTVEQDSEVANMLPKVPLIMGGHEHNSMLVPTANGVIVKADANAKTIYIHTITYNKKTGETKIDSHLMPIDERTPSKPEVKALVDKWNVILNEKIKEVVSDPYEVIYRPEAPLDGTDSASRGIQTNLGGLITEAMSNSFAQSTDVQGAIVNGGSIRIDDLLEGDITSMDIFRVLPFGGHILKVEMEGALLKEVLDFGKANAGTGAYLQRHNISQDPQGKWIVGGKLIEEGQVYTIAVSDFLMLGFDIPFLTKDNPGVRSVYTANSNEAASDIRKAVILWLKSTHL